MSKEKAINKINQAIFLIKPYFEGNLEAIEHRTCEGCFFKGIAGYCGAAPLGLMCLPKYRSDKKNVIFKEVKE